MGGRPWEVTREDVRAWAVEAIQDMGRRLTIGDNSIRNKKRLYLRVEGKSWYLGILLSKRVKGSDKVRCSEGISGG